LIHHPKQNTSKDDWIGVIIVPSSMVRRKRIKKRYGGWGNRERILKLEGGGRGNENERKNIYTDIVLRRGITCPATSLTTTGGATPGTPSMWRADGGWSNPTGPLCRSTQR
jgi:hypothetical protein